MNVPQTDPAARTLHLVQRLDPAALADCRRFSRPGDVIVLIDTGVLALCERGWSDGMPPDVEVACLGADARAQGIEAEASSQRIRILESAELVQLVVACRHCLSWR